MQEINNKVPKTEYSLNRTYFQINPSNKDE